MLTNCRDMWGKGQLTNCRKSCDQVHASVYDHTIRESLGLGLYRQFEQFLSRDVQLTIYGYTVFRYIMMQNAVLADVVTGKPSLTTQLPSLESGKP